MTDGGDAAKPVVLIGGGHAHVEVVRRLGGIGLGREIILVSPSRHTPYSGMLPGFIAGQYRFEDIHIDLVELCRRCGVSFRGVAATGIDPQSRRIQLADGQAIDYALLSINVGSAPQIPAGASGGIAVKPISEFARRLAQIDELAAGRAAPLRIAVVGQGVAGVELALALQHRLRSRQVQFALVGRADHPIPERSPLARRIVEKALQRAGILHHARFDAVGFEPGNLIAGDGRRLAADEVVWATSSAAPAWLRDTGLALDESGFIRVSETLTAVGHPEVFAAGDVASLPMPRAKAGVIAVRQGPILAENIRRSLTGLPLLPFKPQRAWLALISLADGRAVADKWNLAASGRWVARWKHSIDSRFVRRYLNRPATKPHATPR